MFPAVEIRASLDPDPLVEEMTDVQRRVYRAARATAAVVTLWREAIYQHNSRVYQRTVQSLLSSVGCGGSPVEVSRPSRGALAEASRMSAGSIANTYNYDLARAILSIGAATPTANYRTYRSRLFGDTANSIYPGLRNWAAQRAELKAPQIGRTETGNTVNAAIELFYSNNPQLDAQAELRPLQAVCPICQAAVANNPYPNVEAVYAAGNWPAHIGCIHYPQLTGRIMARDCAEVWRG